MVDGRVMAVELDLGNWRVTVMVDDGLVVVSREMDGGWEWYNEMGQGNEWRGRVMEGRFGDRLVISMSPYCMLDGVRQGRRDI